MSTDASTLKVLECLDQADEVRFMDVMRGILKDTVELPLSAEQKIAFWRSANWHSFKDTWIDPHYLKIAGEIYEAIWYVTHQTTTETLPELHAAMLFLLDQF